MQRGKGESGCEGKWLFCFFGLLFGWWKEKLKRLLGCYGMWPMGIGHVIGLEEVKVRFLVVSVGLAGLERDLRFRKFNVRFYI